MAQLVFRTTHSFTPTHKPFPYQEQAFDAIKDMEYCAILHEQGLGKTKIALDLLLYWLSENTVDSVILVVKKGLIANWQKEIDAHTSLKPKLITQNKAENFHAFNAPHRLYLTHFEAIKGEQSRMALFCKTRRVGVVIDEVQKIKNPESALTKSFLALSDGFERRAIMTGTLVANRPYDVWAPICFLDGGESLGEDFDMFKNDYDFSETLPENPHEKEAFEIRLSHLFDRIASFAVRESKDGAGIDLPSKVFRTVTCEWETEQEELYKQIRDDYRAIVERNGLPTVDEAEGILKRLLRLVQVASNPRLVDSGYHCTPGKFLHLEDLLLGTVQSGEKAIVWTSFTDNADWLTSRLSSFGAVKVHGKMAIEARNKSIERFLTEDSVRVLVATPGAAKEGLTLTVANHVIFFDRSFSLDDYLQSQDRIHRISQTRTCYVHNLVMRDSVDEWVDVLLAEKELAAKLTHGDIGAEEFGADMNYQMFAVLKSVLALEE
ncbi:DEAD/DEAH box helicase [Ruegeria arenilitoris]|uniref:DEAD/DEAH box helicase n=1 Tax=Ruegeria arenilitoris TaxID=1173585 RepID=UPI00148072AA|nr:DEAD/DEAH box helicase [Ruegeria arenilitoris]